MVSLVGLVYGCVPDTGISLLSKPFPRRIGMYNGVGVKDIAFFERNDRQPYKKDILWKATKSALEPGDSVIAVGGGKGIVPVKIAQRGHEVTVIEGGREYALQLEQTAGLNAIDMEVVHGIVGDGENVWGDSIGAQTIPPSDLQADVVVLDCQGAEQSILPLPDIEKVVVESHPMHGVSESEVRELLDKPIVNSFRNHYGGQVLVSEK